MENILDETIIIIIIEDQQFKFKNFKEYHQKLEYFKTEKIENKIIDIIIKEELIKFVYYFAIIGKPVLVYLNH